MVVLLAPLTLLACGAGSSESDDDAEQALRRKKSSAVATGATFNLRIKNGGFVGPKTINDPLRGFSLRMKLGDTLRVVNDDSEPFDVIENNDPIKKVIAPGASADFKPTRGNSVDFLSAFPTRSRRTNIDTSELLLEFLDPNTPLPTQPCCDLPAGDDAAGRPAASRQRCAGARQT